MADTEILTLSKNAWTQWPNPANDFTATNSSANAILYVVVSSVEPTIVGVGHPWHPGTSMSRLSSGIHWAWANTDGVRVVFTEDDR